ncbi:MAG: DUF3105 domain-containing protein [Chloroflexi bacterium]|nr:DUF3105 domain-containing protein [Chloroflexota bacterium]
MTDKERIATTRPESRRGMSRGQIREERRTRSRSRARRKRSLLMFGGILFALVFISALVLSPNLTPRTGGGLRGVNTGGHIELDVDDGAFHIQGNAWHTGTYSVVPATSGPHWIGPTTPAGFPAPARWGPYEQALPNEILIHNLEHGGIGLHYDCDDPCPELVQALDDIIPRNSSQFILSPYVNMPQKIAITSWRHHLYLDEVDEEEIRKFIDEYQDRARESVQTNLY